MRIRAKTTLIFSLLSLVPLIVVGEIAYENGKCAIRTSLGTSFRQLANAAIEKVDRALYEVYHNVRTWAHLELMQDILENDTEGEISDFLVSIGIEYGYFSHLVVLNQQGHVVASNNPALMGHDFSHEDCGQAVAEKSHVKDVHFNPMVQKWVVTFAFPIPAKFPEQAVIGTFCAEWNAEELLHMARLTRDISKSLQEDLLLLRNDGLLIAGPEKDADDVFKRNLLDQGLQSAQLALQGQAGSLVEQLGDRTTALIGYDHSKGFRDFLGLGWSALVVQDARIAFAPINRLRFMILWISMTVAWAVISISFFVARQMTEPILTIAHVASQVTHGDFSGRVEHESRDEVGSLARTFNQMVNDLKRQRTQLVDKEYVDNIIKSMTDTLIVVDLNGNIRTVNEAVCRLLGRTEAELLGQPISMVFAGGEFPLKFNAVNGREDLLSLNHIEQIYVNKDGRAIPVLFSSAVLHDGEQRVQGVVCMAQDVTERKQTEEALKQRAAELARSNSELERFASVASHDLQEPLRVVASYVQLLARRYQGQLGPDADEFIHFAVTGVTRMQTLINDLLTYSRVGTKGREFTVTDVEAVLAQALTNLQVAITEGGATITHDPLPAVLADGAQLTQVFQNLLANAVKFRRTDTPSHIHVTAQRQGPDWVFAVRDNGIGFEPQYAERIFGIFQRLHTNEDYPGTGIGLAICKKIIERHGGKIWVNSKLGQGATFSFLLPGASSNDKEPST